MKQEPSRSAQQARFMRKHQKEAGVDQEQEAQDQNFNEDFQKAIKNHSKKAITHDIEKQIEYFGYKMQPFNMKEQQEIGQIDEEGFFVKNKRRFRDAWLDSLNDDGQQAIETMRKKIKLQQRQKAVHEGDNRLNQKYKSDDQDSQVIEQQASEQQESKISQRQAKQKNLKKQICLLLPFSTSANQYMKKLKKQKKSEEYTKILQLCNEYIAMTEEHDILTLKKQELQECFSQQQNEEKPINNWDDSEDEASSRGNKKEQSHEEEGDQDDIF